MNRPGFQKLFGRMLRRSAMTAAGVLLLVCLADAGRAQTHAALVTYDVSVMEPASGMIRVRAEIAAGIASDAAALQLRFRDLRQNPGAVKDFRAWSGDKPLRCAAGSERQDVWTIELPVHSEAVIIEYTVDPTYYPPGKTSGNPVDARSRVCEEMAVIRTSSVFPILDPAFESARVTFHLPEEWVPVAPWHRDGGGFLLTAEDLRSVDYVALGPFDVREIAIAGTDFLVAAPRTEKRLRARQLAALFEHFLALVGSPPPTGAGPRAATIVPPGFMNGGAAGNRSIVQGPYAVVLAHEVFHWWTHSELVRPDAKWFSEGFTNYAAIEAAKATGLITESEAAYCLGDLAGEMRFLESEGPRKLAMTEEEYVRDGCAQRLIYSKGTLLAFLLHRELAIRDRSLDEVMKRILSQRRVQLSNADLRRFMMDTYGEAIASRLDAFVHEAEALPDLGFGPPTRRSGCARCLPAGPHDSKKTD